MLIALGLSRWFGGKESACQFRRCRRLRFDPWVGKIPWRRAWQPTPVFLPGKSHGQRSLAGYSPWGCKRVGHGLATKQQHALLKRGCYVLYSAKDATHMASVMPYRLFDVVNRVRVMTPISCCDVTCIVYMLPYILDVVSYIVAVMS